MIQVINLTKKYDETTALSNLSVDIKPGITGIVGQNGAGKSTLLRIAAGVCFPTEGSVLINGNLSDSTKSKETVFFLPDEPYAPLKSDVNSVFEFYDLFYNIDKEKYFNLIDLFKLPLNRDISKFSKGMRRMVFIALALSINVDILLLDEAFDGLDPLTLQTVKEQIVKLCDNDTKTVVISSHNITSLEKFVDRFIILSEGSFLTDGDIEMMSEKFAKYQAIFDEGTCSQNYLESVGLNVVSYKELGSFVTFVILKDDNSDKTIKKLHAKHLEEAPIEKEETLILEMSLANKEK